MTMFPPSYRRAASPVLLVACSLVAGIAARAQNANLLIGDFDKTIETVSGLSPMVMADAQLGGTSEARLTLIQPGANASRSALRISFRVTDDFPAPFAGVWALLKAEGPVADLSAYRGVRFSARNKDGRPFTAGIVQFSDQLRRYMTPFETRAEWTVVELPFDKFRQVTPSGAPIAGALVLVPKDLTSIGVSVPPPLRGQFDLDIDQMELYR
jgi:hypothetical protein